MMPSLFYFFLTLNVDYNSKISSICEPYLALTNERTRIRWQKEPFPNWRIKILNTVVGTTGVPSVTLKKENWILENTSLMSDLSLLEFMLQRIFSLSLSLVLIFISARVVISHFYVSKCEV